MNPYTPVALTDLEWAVVIAGLLTLGESPLAGEVRDQLFEQWRMQDV